MQQLTRGKTRRRPIAAEQCLALNAVIAFVPIKSLQRKSFGAWRGVSSAFCTSLSSLENVRLPRHYSCRDIEARRALQRHLYELLFKHCWQRDEDRLLTHVCISAEARVDLIVSCDQRCDAQTGGLHLWLPDTPFLSLSSTRVVYHWSKRL